MPLLLDRKYCAKHPTCLFFLRIVQYKASLEVTPTISRSAIGEEATIEADADRTTETLFASPRANFLSINLLL